MNILFLSTRYPYPPDCGHYLRTYHTVQYLARSNRVFFLSFLEKGEIPDIHTPMHESCASIDVFVLPEDASRFRLLLSFCLNIFSPLPFVAEKYYDNRMYQRMMQILKKERIDLIHVDMLPLARYVSDISNIPIYLVEHNVEYLRVRRWVKTEKNPLVRASMVYQAKKLRRFEKKLLPRFQRVFSVSHVDAEELHKLAPEGHYVVVPNAVDVDYFRPIKKPYMTKKMIWTGGAREVYNRKAIDFLLKEIVPLVLSKVSKAELILIGDTIGKYFPNVDQYPGISFVGHVDDVRPFFGDAGVFVAPILCGGGTKLKILNAMAMARPVVTTKAGIEGIDAEAGVHYLAAETAKQFAEQAVWLLKNPQIADIMGKNARRLIEKHYTWDVVMKKMDYGLACAQE